jgi:hypothetical protein
MIAEFVSQWDAHKQHLEEWFQSTTIDKIEYETIVKKLIELVINRDSKHGYEYDKMVVIDHGDYQGTQLFVIPKRCYQPDVSDYVYTHNYYGSCSGCDTLQSICDYRYGKTPDENQLSQLMTLALHLLQQFKRFERDDA